METIDWTYAISTLIIRFVGIFVVLGVLQVVMQISGRIFAHIDAKKDRPQPDVVPPQKDLTQEEAAAVATALYLHEKND
ncbi:MAG: hypothetical protein JRJ17_02745 [Deltaproteobacteria bacterium]|nr:hypothetical protein [Deltaproteobacteria bacterium]